MTLLIEKSPDPVEQTQTLDIANLRQQYHIEAPRDVIDEFNQKLAGQALEQTVKRLLVMQESLDRAA